MLVAFESAESESSISFPTHSILERSILKQRNSGSPRPCRILWHKCSHAIPFPWPGPRRNTHRDVDPLVIAHLARRLKLSNARLNRFAGLSDLQAPWSDARLSSTVPTNS